MATIAVRCSNCGGSVEKDTREYNRSTRLARQLYCGRTCAAVARNAPFKAAQIELTCECGARFTTTTRVKAVRHCSRACASRYSAKFVGPEGREAQRRAGLANAKNLISTAEVLKKREAWKYAALDMSLRGRSYEFEYALGGYVFDLALFDTRVLVEFDARYHDAPQQQAVDAVKNEVARQHGYTVERRRTKGAVVLHPDLLKGL